MLHFRTLDFGWCFEKTLLLILTIIRMPCLNPKNGAALCLTVDVILLELFEKIELLTHFH